jgi:O-antigen ligase
MPLNASTAKFLTPVLVLFAFLMGPVGAAAPKALVVLVIAGGGAGLVHWFSSGRPATLVPRFLGVIASVLFLWALLTALWAPDGWRALSLTLKLAALSGTGLGLVYGMGILDEPSRGRMGNALLWGVGLGVGILGAGYVYAMTTGKPLWGNYDFDPLTTMNNGAVVLSLLLWPATAILWRRERRLAAFLFLAAVVGFLFLFSSGAALLGAGAGILVFALNAGFGRRGGIAVAFVMAAMVVSAPFAISQIPEVKKVVSALPGLAPSAQHRLHMWKFVVERIEEKKCSAGE